MFSLGKFIENPFKWSKNNKNSVCYSTASHPSLFISPRIYSHVHNRTNETGTYSTQDFGEFSVKSNKAKKARKPKRMHSINFKEKMLPKGMNTKKKHIKKRENYESFFSNTKESK